MNPVLIIVAVIAFAAYTALVWTKGGENALAGYKEEQQAAQAKIDDQAKQIEEDAANKIIDMDAAYIAGEANAKTVERKVYVKIAADLQKYPVFQNPACVLPLESYALLVAALRGVRGTFTLPAETAPVPAAPPPAPATSSGPPPKPVPLRRAP